MSNNGELLLYHCGLRGFTFGYESDDGPLVGLRHSEGSLYALG